MENIDWFRFENKDLDFPFYRKNPYIPKWGWILLFIVLPVGLVLTISSKIHILIVSCLVLIVPVLYFLNWDYHAIFQMPKPKDVALAVALFVGYIIYALVMSTALEYFGIAGGNLMGSEPVTLMTIASLFFSLMSEEFVKFIPFMFFLRLLYKYTEKRKLSVVVSVIMVMVFFASIHAYSFNMFIFALFIQGFGSIFEYIGYIKTKNILISYITHLCTDVFIFALAFLSI